MFMTSLDLLDILTNEYHTACMETDRLSIPRPVLWMAGADARFVYSTLLYRSSLCRCAGETRFWIGGWAAQIRLNMWNFEYLTKRWCIRCLLPLGCLAASAPAQPHNFTWQEIREKFQQNNPTMRAAQIGIDESRAQEITAYLRPNPDLTGSFDQMNFFSTQPPPNGGPAVYSPFAYAFPSASISYLHERQHKRELRLESAQKGTAITMSQYADQERNLLFNLRTAFVQTLQQKAILALTKRVWPFTIACWM